MEPDRRVHLLVRQYGRRYRDTTTKMGGDGNATLPVADDGDSATSAAADDDDTATTRGEEGNSDDVVDDDRRTRDPTEAHGTSVTRRTVVETRVRTDRDRDCFCPEGGDTFDRRNADGRFCDRNRARRSGREAPAVVERAPWIPRTDVHHHETRAAGARTTADHLYGADRRRQSVRVVFRGLTSEA